MFVAEIGDVTRFERPAQLASWAGLTPRHHESDTTVHRGRITKQGSRLVRWAAVEAAQHAAKTEHLGQLKERIAARRGRNIATVAAAASGSGWCSTGCVITRSAVCTRPARPDAGPGTWSVAGRRRS